MLNTFPDLLVFSFFAPTLLRIGAAGVLFYLAYFYIVHQEEIGRSPLPLIGAVGPRIAWLMAIVAGLIRAGLLFGYYTQIMALLGMVEYAVYRRFYPHLMAVRFPLSRSTMLLFFIICLSLLISGAGAMAYDLQIG